LQSLYFVVGFGGMFSLFWFRGVFVRFCVGSGLC
jgi:hypothetical protein